MHRGVPVPAPADLAVPHEAIAVEEPDRAVRDIERRALPVADDVGFLDHRHPDVGHLLGGHHLVDGARVGRSQRANGQLVHGSHSTPKRADPSLS
jgi:hypothetical protein